LRGAERGNIIINKVDHNGFLDTIGEMSARILIGVFAALLIIISLPSSRKTRHANLTKTFHWFGATNTQRFSRLNSRFKV
jgi:hypothetical protein